ncbi:hypothetical protein NC651_026873 [Populus alba x Populus x berolinensis]|nr:hypothetical protein NC651_026873 [Populus alba x Populus x berolinensis]
MKAQHVLTIHFYSNSIYEELKSLRVKVIALEHDLHKSCQKASKNHDLCYQLEKFKSISGFFFSCSTLWFGLIYFFFLVSYFQEYDVLGNIIINILCFVIQVIELLHSFGKSERGLAITCLKSILCRTGKRVCLVCKDFLIQNMDSTTPYTEPFSVRKLNVLVSLFFIVIY